MRPIGASKTILGSRRTWNRPVVTTLAIGTETKLSRGVQPEFTQPEPPAAPSTKLGFSLEMAFPLSARTEQ